ncbi:MAG: helix-turn-helix domain-containing protein [Promethearchaeota archaeon]
MKPSQKEQILQALISDQKLTKMDILRRFGCWNSGGRIFELRQEGWPIKTEMINVRTMSDKNTPKIALYSIPNEALINLEK